MKLVSYDKYLFSIVDTDALVLRHQGISNHNAKHTHTCVFSSLWVNWLIQMSWKLILSIANSNKRRCYKISHMTQQHAMWKNCSNFMDSEIYQRTEFDYS